MNNMYDILEKMKLLEGKASKPDFLDLDKDGDREEPMKKAAKEKKVDEADIDEVAPPGLQAAGGSIGGILGAGIGAALGGFAGSAATGAIFPGPEGAVPGAVAGGIAGAVKGAGVGGRLGRKATDFTHDQLVNLWRKASATLGGPEATLDFVHAHANAANKGRYSFNYQGKNYAVTMDEQQARQAMRDLDKMTGGDLGTRRVERDRQRVRDLYHDAKMIEADMDEGNDFTGARSAAIKAGKPTFSVRGKTYRVTGDTSDEKMMEKKEKTLWPGTPEYKAKFGHEMKTGEKKRSSTGGEIEKTATGVKHTKSYDDDEEETKADDGTPKRRGRPKGSKRALGAKGPTGKSKLLKGKSIREEGMEDEEMIAVVDKGEYDREGDMAREQLHTVMDAAKELHSILDADDNLPEWVQSKITKALDYLDTARDYVKASDAEDQEVAEVAPPGAKAERMVKHIKKGYAKDGKLTPREKSIAYATAWKAHKAGRVEEESDDTRDDRAERAGKKVTKDIEYDEKVKDKIHGEKRGSEDSKAERAGKKVTKDIEYDEKKKEEVDETTTSGSVATAPAEAPKGKKGMIFGKGVYEGYEEKYKRLLTEGMSINMSVGEDGTKSLNVNATDEDAVKLAQILKLAGMEQADGYHDACSSCGQTPCGCEGLEEAEYANSPEETGADINTLVNTYSDGLDGQKTTGQTTIPVVAGQTQRMMSQVQEQAEQRLWDLYKRYESK